LAAICVSLFLNLPVGMSATRRRNRRPRLPREGLFPVLSRPSDRASTKSRSSMTTARAPWSHAVVMSWDTEARTWPSRWEADSPASSRGMVIAPAQRDDDCAARARFRSRRDAARPLASRRPSAHRAARSRPASDPGAGRPRAAPQHRAGRLGAVSVPAPRPGPPPRTAPRSRATPGSPGRPRRHGTNPADGHDLFHARHYAGQVRHSIQLDQPREMSFGPAGTACPCDHYEAVSLTIGHCHGNSSNP
jgi:hypothetical protein